MQRIMKSKRTMAATAVAVLAIAGAAFAYWTTSGSGTGSATTGDVSAITVSQTSTVAGLYPGGPAQAIDGTLSNGNDSKVKIGEVTAKVTGTDKAGCDASDFDISGSAPVNAEVAKGTDVAFSGLKLAMVNKAGQNQDPCKNAAVHIAYSAVPAA